MAIPSARVRISHQELPDRFRPCYYGRREGVTIILTDPRSTRVEVVAWMIDNLTVGERNCIRAAVGEAPVGTPLRPETLDGLSRVPPSLKIVDRRRPVAIVGDQRGASKVDAVAWTRRRATGVRFNPKTDALDDAV